MAGESLKNPASRALAWEAYGLDAPSGIRTYGLELQRALHAIDVSPVVVRGLEVSTQLPSVTSVAGSRLLRAGRKFLQPLASYATARRLPQSASGLIFHGLSNINLPVLGRKPRRDRFVVTVHDIIPLLAPGQVSKSLALQFKVLMDRVVRRADALICVSQWTQDTLLDHYRSHGLEARTRVIRNGVDHLSAAAPGEDWPPKASETAGNLPRVLFVSRFEPYKGFGILTRILAEKAGVWQFDIVTDPAGRRFLQANLPRSEGMKRNFLVHCGVSVGELRKLYGMSNVVLHPSRYEGFGLPVYEALSFGKPAVCRSTGPWPELSSCPLVRFVDDNDDPTAWVDAIDAVLAAQPFQGTYSGLIEQYGLQTWGQAATEVKSLYNSL